MPVRPDDDRAAAVDVSRSQSLDDLRKALHDLYNTAEKLVVRRRWRSGVLDDSGDSLNSTTVILLRRYLYLFQ